MTLTLDVDAFPSLHPHLDPGLAGYARSALARHGASPKRFRALKTEAEESATISFGPTDDRIDTTYERETVVEHGAIVIAGLLLCAWEAKVITRVCKRGSRVDYFVGEKEGDQRWILEVSGTDFASHEARRASKRAQLRASPYRRPRSARKGSWALPDSPSLASHHWIA